MKKFKLRTCLFLCSILVSSSLLARKDSSFVKSNRYGFHFGRSNWEQPTTGSLNGVDIIYRAARSPDIGLYMERTFYPKVYYAVAINYMQLNTSIDLSFNRNDFYPWFGSQENGPNSPLILAANYKNQSIGFSFSMGYEWVNAKEWLIKTAIGLNGAHFISGQESSVVFTELQTINGIQYPIETARIWQPRFNGGIKDIADRRVLVPALRLNGEVIHKLKGIHLGLGYNVNFGLRKLIRSSDSISFLPMSLEYRQKTNSEMKFNYWGFRAFIGF